MTRIEQMMKMHPTHGDMDTKMMMECLEACMECMETCAACADACLAEKNADKLKKCIRLNQDCADICDAMCSILSRQTETEWAIIRDMMEAMATCCRMCAEECEKHASMMEFCKICAEACRRCERSCRKMMQAMPVAA